MRLNLLVLALLAVLLSGCLPTVFQKGTGQKQTGPSEFAQGQLVSGFPPLPSYPEAQTIESVSEGDAKGASFVTGDDVDKVINYYSDALPQLGWEFQLLRLTETNYEFKVKNIQYEGSIIVNVAADNRSTAITYSITLR